MIDNLTIGNKVSGNDAGQVIARADVLTANGASIIEDTSERANPDAYYALDNNVEVSYSFNASKAFKGQVIAYLGNPDTNQSDSTNKNKKIGDAVTC